MHIFNILPHTTYIKHFKFYRTAPDLFVQVYIVFGHLPDGQVLPCAFGLLPDKQLTTYKAVWAELKDAVDAGQSLMTSPEVIMMDFELAEMNACAEIYPQANIIGCNFHFMQNIQRNVAQKGAKKQFNESPMFQKLVDYMCALVYVPSDKVLEAWEAVIEPYLSRNQEYITEEMDAFIDYFVETYLGKVGRNGRRGQPRIKINRWNKFEYALRAVPCTNNGAEAFNGAWNKSTPPQASVWTILDGFLREEGLAAEKYRCFRHYGGQATANRARRSFEEEKRGRLQRLVQQFDMANLKTYLQDVVNII